MEYRQQTHERKMCLLTNECPEQDEEKLENQNKQTK